MILIIFVCDITGFHHLNCKDKKRDQADFLRSDAVQSSEEETVGADAVESSEAHSHNPVPPVPLFPPHPRRPPPLPPPLFPALYLPHPLPRRSSYYV